MDAAGLDHLVTRERVCRATLYIFDFDTISI